MESFFPRLMMISIETILDFVLWVNIHIHVDMNKLYFLNIDALNGGLSLFILRELSQDIVPTLFARLNVSISRWQHGERRFDRLKQGGLVTLSTVKSLNLKTITLPIMGPNNAIANFRTTAF